MALLMSLTQSLSMQLSESSIMVRNVIHTTALETRTQVVPPTGMVRNALLANYQLSIHSVLTSSDYKYIISFAWLIL